MAASVSGKQILAENFVLNVNESFLMPRLSSELRIQVTMAAIQQILRYFQNVTLKTFDARKI